MKLARKIPLALVTGMLIISCSDVKESDVQKHPIRDGGNGVAETTEVEFEGFSWVVPGELAAMPLPGRNHPLEDDVAFLDGQGIRVLVSLTEVPPDADVLASRTIDQKHIPVEDYTPPTLDQMIEFVSIVEESVAAGHPVGVHCTAGLGRSGTTSAAYLVAKGAPAEEAIATVRQLRPGSIETSEQEDAVVRFEEYLIGSQPTADTTR